MGFVNLRGRTAQAQRYALRRLLVVFEWHTKQNSIIYLSRTRLLGKLSSI